MDELTTIAAYPEVTIGAHSVTHPVMPDCNDENLRFEIAECKRALESWTGQSVTCFAYPEGKFDGRERRLLIESGYELAVTTRSAFLTRDTDCYLAPRFIAGDDVSFPQAICSMLGIWRPVADPLKELRKRMARALRGAGPVAVIRAAELQARRPRGRHGVLCSRKTIHDHAHRSRRRRFPDQLCPAFDGRAAPDGAGSGGGPMQRVRRRSERTRRSRKFWSC